MNKLHQTYVIALLIIALVTAGISPACAFISGGTSFIQICAADGSVKTIEVSDEFSPFEEEKPQQDHMETQDDCVFCFANTVQKASGANGGGIVIGTHANMLRISSGTLMPLQSRRTLYAPRAPPVSVV